MSAEISISNGRNGTPETGTAGVVILCVIMVVSVLLYGAVDTGTLALLSFLSFLLIGYWALSGWRVGNLPIDLNTIQLPIIALGPIGVVQLMPLRGGTVPPGLLDVAASASISLDPYATRFFLMRLFLYVIFFAAALTFVNSVSRLRMMVVTLITFGALIAFYSILQRVEDSSTIYWLRQPAQAIPFGTFINRHHFAALMEMTLGLTLGILFAGGVQRNRWIFIILGAVVMAISIVLTGSRGGLIGLLTSLISIAAFSAYGRRDKRDRGDERGISPVLILAAAGVFLIFTIGLVVFLGGADPLLRSSGAGTPGGAGDISSGRIEFWQTALKIFVDHPIIGVGLDAFGVAYSAYDPSSGMFRVEQAHNDYLQTLADSGLLGFACVAAFIYLLLKKGASVIGDISSGFRRGAAVGALAGCAGILVHSFFDFPLRTPANAFVFLALAAISVADLNDVKPRRRRSRSRKDRPSTDSD
jgi:O-antigen ligase